jgi:hypothetical protein
VGKIQRDPFLRSRLIFKTRQAGRPDLFRLVCLGIRVFPQRTNRAR